MKSAANVGARPDPLAAAAPVVFVVLWSTGPVATKLGVADVAALDLLGWRFALLAAVAGPFGLLTRRFRRLDRAAIAHCAVAGVLIQAIYLGTAFTALDLGMSAGLSAVITGLQPVTAMVFAAWLLGERPGRGQLAGTAVALAGLLVYAGHRLAGPDLAPLPLALHLAGVISIGAGIVYQRRFCSGVGLVDNIAVQHIACAVVVVALVALLPDSGGHWSFRALAALGWLVVVVSLGATMLLLLLANRGHVARTATLFALMPPTTAVIAALVLGEPLSGPVLVGLALAGAGVAMVLYAAPAR